MLNFMAEIKIILTYSSDVLYAKPTVKGNRHAQVTSHIMATKSSPVGAGRPIIGMAFSDLPRNGLGKKLAGPELCSRIRFSARADGRVVIWLTESLRDCWWCGSNGELSRKPLTIRVVGICQHELQDAADKLLLLGYAYS